LSNDGGVLSLLGANTGANMAFSLSERAESEDDGQLCTKPLRDGKGIYVAFPVSRFTDRGKILDTGFSVTPSHNLRILPHRRKRPREEEVDPEKAEEIPLPEADIKRHQWITTKGNVKKAGSSESLMLLDRFQDICESNKAFIKSSFPGEAEFVVPCKKFKRGGTRCKLCGVVQTEKSVCYYEKLQRYRYRCVHREGKRGRCKKLAPKGLSGVAKYFSPLPPRPKKQIKRQSKPKITDPIALTCPLDPENLVRRDFKIAVGMFCDRMGVEVSRRDIREAMERAYGLAPGTLKTYKKMIRSIVHEKYGIES